MIYQRIMRHARPHVTTCIHSKRAIATVNKPRAAVAAYAADSFPTAAYDPDLVNKVMLTGFTGKNVELVENQYGKTARVTLAVTPYKPPTEAQAQPIWFDVWFRDEQLAQRAAQEVKKGERVHVQGRLVLPTAEDRGSKGPMVYADCLLRVKSGQTPAVPSPPAPVPTQPRAAPAAAAPKRAPAVAAPAAAPAPPGPTQAVPRSTPQQVAAQKQQRGSSQAAAGDSDVSQWTDEQKWESVLTNPELWWDNRYNKKNPKAPDFKWKADPQGPALWLNSKTPKDVMDALNMRT